MKKLALSLSLLASTALASEWRIVEPKDVHVDLYKYEEPRHDPYLDPVDADLSHGGAFNLDLDMLKYRGYGLYWKNQLFFDQSWRTGKVVHGGWQYEAGLTVWTSKAGKPRVEFFQQHESRHIFETTRDVHFPVYDRYGVRFQAYP